MSVTRLPLKPFVFLFIGSIGQYLGCGFNTGASTRLSETDYDQSCHDVTQCILVELDVCNPCQCPDSVIAQAAYTSFNDDRYQLQQTYCPERSEPTSCPNCDLREPVCRDESCLIK